MIHGQWLDAIIADEGTVSAEVDLGRQYETMLVIIPTIDTAQVTFQVAEKTGGTFQALHITDTVAGDNNEVKSASGTGAFTWVVPIGGFQFIKVKSSATQSTAAVTFRVCGIRS